jgi:hypothetical protein
LDGGAEVKKSRAERIGEKAMKQLYPEGPGDATPEEVEFVTNKVGATFLNLRAHVVLQGLSEGNNTVQKLADYTGFELNIIADAARELVDTGFALERAPGIWRLTPKGWDRAMEG